MGQRIAGQPGEALARFAAERRSFPVPPIPQVNTVIAEIELPKVTEPGISLHPTWKVTEPEPRTRRRRRRAMPESPKKRAERLRTTPATRVGRAFRSRYDGTCRACGAHFEADAMIAKADPKGFVHVDCYDPAASEPKEMTPTRQAVRDIIAASRFSPREADPS